MDVAKGMAEALESLITLAVKYVYEVLAIAVPGGILVGGVGYIYRVDWIAFSGSPFLTLCVYLIVMYAVGRSLQGIASLLERILRVMKGSTERTLARVNKDGERQAQTLALEIIQTKLDGGAGQAQRSSAGTPAESRRTELKDDRGAIIKGICLAGAPDRIQTLFDRFTAYRDMARGMATTCLILAILIFRDLCLHGPDGAAIRHGISAMIGCLILFAGFCERASSMKLYPELVAYSNFIARSLGLDGNHSP